LGIKAQETRLTLQEHDDDYDDDDYGDIFAATQSNSTIEGGTKK
jgi:hypothetical protein